MLKKDYKVHVSANCAFVGLKYAQAASVSTRATFVMVDVNATVGTLQDQQSRPMEGIIIGMCMALKLKKSSSCVR
jgi:hypothetical protein